MQHATCVCAGAASFGGALVISSGAQVGRCHTSSSGKGDALMKLRDVLPEGSLKVGGVEVSTESFLQVCFRPPGLSLSLPPAGRR